jgi:hypothetical protein
MLIEKVELLALGAKHVGMAGEVGVQCGGATLLDAADEKGGECHDLCAGLMRPVIESTSARAKKRGRRVAMRRKRERGW